SGALRLRIPDEGATVVDDLIHGPVTFDHRQLDDWILVRTDGTPTYNFCVVVDDVTMRISHVIRGNDHLSNTPKQVLCYEALGYPVPAFAHVSMILGADRTRLSKRHGATSVDAYREQGILPDAMVNYLARLGWSSGDQEIFSRTELVERFDIKDVSSSGAIFDQTKLEWLNHEYIKTIDGARLAALVTPWLTAAGLTPPADAARFVGMLDTLRERASAPRAMRPPERLHPPQGGINETPARATRRDDVERGATLPGPDGRRAVAARPRTGRGARRRAARLPHRGGLRQLVPARARDGGSGAGRHRRARHAGGGAARALARRVGGLHGRRGARARGRSLPRMAAGAA